MSRSGNQIWDALKETLRIHFKRILCHGIDLKMDSPTIYFTLGIQAVCYGGAIVKKRLQCIRLDMTLKPPSRCLDIMIQAELHASPVLLVPPPLVYVPILQPILPQQIHQGRLLTQRLPIMPCVVQMKQAQLQMPIVASQLRIRLGETHRYAIKKFKKPGVFKMTGIKPKWFKMPASKRAFPITRQAIPPHRFSKVHRELFRERLAKKAQIQGQDVQIVGVYDRIYLGLYQSISQTQEGALLCVPKLNQEAGMTAKKQESSYLVIGKSYKQPGKTFQVMITLAEFEHVQS